MPHELLPRVPRETVKQHVLGSLRRYWSRNEQLLLSLPIPTSRQPVEGPLSLVDVPLPEWAAACGVDGSIAVPRECCPPEGRPAWAEVDWWLAIFLLLEGWHERLWESRHGPLHSYAFRLHGWDPRAWEHAWVNRIALFLRVWAARSEGDHEEQLFGPRPVAEIFITHDVDAVSKTWAIRLKQGVFSGVNALRLLVKGRRELAARSIGAAASFLRPGGEWWTLGSMLEMERQAGVRSQFNFYADDRPKSLSRWFFDPGYDVVDARIAEVVREMVREGWKVGLHQSFDAWQSSERMRHQRQRLQSVAGAPVTGCRQHWLRFSWRDTWVAQAAAGMEQDSTLMFNDRPGFRVSAAVAWHPWDPITMGEHRIQALPSVFMDSHFYDYLPMTSVERRAAMRDWLLEVAAVGGQIAVLWHPHTITADYGWLDGFQELLELSKGEAAC